ncbi:hypothetical protein [Microbacterium immunditiarum]|uniref:Uncharacterized protein n=1 Tax=Microbacterium immunditiarum TaxID=337480 RepID=A0A7Y9GPW6_9MICO|nr:hypothetical protein [Microbacterium immunditiarum]NYE20524.1 hypothetical protein [Microbacterium immunditiarum]
MYRPEDEKMRYRRERPDAWQIAASIAAFIAASSLVALVMVLA